MRQELLRTTISTGFQSGVNSVTVELITSGLLNNIQKSLVNCTAPEFNSDSKERNFLLDHFTLSDITGSKIKVTEYPTFHKPEQLFFVQNINCQFKTAVIVDGCKINTTNLIRQYNSNETKSAQC